MGLPGRSGKATSMIQAGLASSKASPIVSESATYLHAVLNSVGEGIITFNERGGIELFNAAAERFFGYTSVEITGQNIKRLMPIIFQSKNTGQLANRLMSGDPAILGDHADMVGRRKDGTTFPIDVSVNDMGIEERQLFICVVRDTSERKAEQEELTQTRDRYMALLDNVSDLVTVHDSACIYLFVSPSSLDLLGYAPIELVGTGIFTYMHPEDRALVIETYKRLAATDSECRLRFRLKPKTQDYIWIETYSRVISGLYAANPEFISISHVVQDGQGGQASLLEDKKRAERRGKIRDQLALRDELTSLMNKKGVNGLLKTRLASRRASTYPFGCLILDVDHLDRINSTYGQAVGDKVLQTIGQLLVDCCRTEDYIGRYEGDEFVVILPNTDASGTVMVAERIVATVGLTNWSELAPGQKVTVSVGGTCVKHASDMILEELFEIIGSQLSLAKQMGRNRFVMNARLTGYL